MPRLLEASARDIAACGSSLRTAGRTDTRCAQGVGGFCENCIYTCNIFSRQYIHCLFCYLLTPSLTSPLPSSCSAWLRATERSSQLPHLRVLHSLGLLPHTEDLLSRAYVTAFLLHPESCVLPSHHTSSIILFQEDQTLI